MKTRSLLTFLIALLPAILAGLLVYNWQKEDDKTETSTSSSSAIIETESTTTPDNTDASANIATPLLEPEIHYPATQSRLSPLGINTNEVFEQDASIPFVDLFRVATPFHENIRCREQDKPCLTSAEVEYDADGWPKALHGGKAGAFFLRNVALAALPDGDFHVLYEGEGELTYLHNVDVITREPGMDTIRFTAREDGFMTAALQITQSNPENPLKNIRIVMPGGICSDNPFQHASQASACKDAAFLDYKTYYASIIFNPDYLNFMKDFGVIRFMPMSGITRNPASKWENRPTMQEATWGGNYGARGAPLEIQIKLANILNADPWLNVPHAADDNYIRQFAEYVKEHLSPERVPYIEYTNEAWNANFVHNEYMQKMGIAEKLDQDALLAGYKYYAKRSVEFFNIWESVYGGHDKFVRIIAGWDTRPDISGIILAYNDTYRSVDALAIAPYIGGNTRGFRESETVDDIFALLNDEKSYRSLPKIMHELEQHADLAKAFGVALIAYEGGQGLVDWATKDYLQHPNPLFFAANRDQRMKDLYLKLYQEWRDMGAELFVAFSAPRSCNWHGCWGLKEHIRQPLEDAPKLAASQSFIDNNPRWWDWPREQVKPDTSAIAHYLPTIDPDKPRIVIRPAKGNPEHFYRLENPQALNILLEGETWDKRDLSGKWQVKWDDKNIYLTVKVYDKDLVADSEDMRNDDSIEFYIDGDNSRTDEFDKQNDFQIMFGWDKQTVVMGENNPEGKNLDIPFGMEKKYDGYELQAEISWEQLGITPKIADKIGMDVVINDDDDGGERDARISWNTRISDAAVSSKNYGMILISGR